LSGIRAKSSHAGPVPADGSFVLTGSWDGTARIWDTTTGNLRHTLVGHVGRVVACTAWPGGSFVVTGGGDRTARVWDTVTGNVRHILTGHTEPVVTCAVPADGSVIVTGSWDQTVRAWNSATGQPLASIRTDAPVTSCTIGPGARLYLIGSNYLYGLDLIPYESPAPCPVPETVTARPVIVAEYSELDL
jgi:WD40 repeat protein